jgi:aminopeptidase-like protein
MFMGWRLLKLKQHITPNQAKKLTEKQFYGLFAELVPRKDWANYHHKKITIGKLLEIIREYCQMDIHTVNENWCVQLFNIDGGANNRDSCICANQGKELIDVLFDSLLWIIEHVDGLVGEA